MKERGIGTAALIAIVIVIAGAAAGGYYLGAGGEGGGYPSIAANAALSGDNEIRINVTTGSIPTGEWAYSVILVGVEGPYSWTTGTSELASPYVSLGTYASGTYYVSLKHIDSGHLYFNDQTITI